MTKKKPRIVIIEDDAMFSGIYETTFSNAGFDVHMARNGEAGLALLREERPDVAILDLMIPSPSGFEVLAEMRDDRALRKVPVIVVTNLDQHAERGRAMELGAKAYFVKAHAVSADVLEKARELMR